MTNNETLIYLENRCDPKRIAEIVTREFGFLVVADLESTEDYSGAILCDYCSSGFAMNICICWQPQLTPNVIALQLAQTLAQELRTRAALDLPPPHPQSGNPYYWLIVQPNGQNLIGIEDPDADDAVGEDAGLEFQEITTVANGP